MNHHKCYFCDNALICSPPKIINPNSICNLFMIQIPGIRGHKRAESMSVQKVSSKITQRFLFESNNLISRDLNGKTSARDAYKDIYSPMNFFCDSQHFWQSTKVIFRKVTFDEDHDRFLNQRSVRALYPTATKYYSYDKIKHRSKRKRKIN